MAINIWDGVIYRGKYVSECQAVDSDNAFYTVTPLVIGHEYIVKMTKLGNRFRATTFESNPSEQADGYRGIRNLLNKDNPTTSDMFSFTAENGENYLMCYINSGESGASDVVIEVWDMSVSDEPETPDEPSVITYKISSTRLTAIADEVRRLIGTEDKLSLAEIEESLKGVSGGVSYPDVEEVAF